MTCQPLSRLARGVAVGALHRATIGSLRFAAACALVTAISLPSRAARAQDQADDIPACPSGDLALAPALERAAQDNPDVVIARRNADAAAAGITVAGERPNPTLNAGINQWDPRPSHRGNGPYQQPLFASIQLQQLIERGGKRDARLSQAQAQTSAAKADVADRERQVGAAVRGAYYDLKLAQAKADTLRDIAGLQQQTLDAADRRVKLGDIAAADRARIALEALKAGNDARQAQADAITARLAFGALLGCAARDDLKPADDWPSEAGNAPAPSRRADEFADAQRLAAADAALKLAKAQASRDVTVGVEWDHDPREAPNMAGVSISVPLFLSHRYEGEIAQAQAQREAAAATLRQTHLQVDGDRATANAALAAAAANRDSAVNEVAPQAEAAAAAVEYAYSRGAAPLLDLLDARRTLRAARLDALSAQNDFAHALIARDAALAAYLP